jgi:hypothetical protein
MRKARRLVMLAGLAGLTLVSSHVPALNGQAPTAAPPRTKREMDRGKTALIEPGVKRIVQGASDAQQIAAPANSVIPSSVTPNGGFPFVKPRLDVGKRSVIEPHVRQALVPPTPRRGLRPRSRASRYCCFS